MDYLCTALNKDSKSTTEGKGLSRGDRYNSEEYDRDDKYRHEEYDDDKYYSDDYKDDRYE